MKWSEMSVLLAAPVYFAFLFVVGVVVILGGLFVYLWSLPYPLSRIALWPRKKYLVELEPHISPLPGFVAKEILEAISNEDLARKLNKELPALHVEVTKPDPLSPVLQVVGPMGKRNSIKGKINNVVTRHFHEVRKIV